MTDEIRKPLVAPPPAERLAKLHQMGYTLIGNVIVPLGLTPLEIEAILRGSRTEDGKMEGEPIVGPKAAGFLAALGALLGLLAGGASAFAFLPVWAPFAISVAAATCLYLAGKSIPGLKIGAPLLPGTLVPGFIAASGALASFASQLAPGKLQGGLLLLASVLAGLAGAAAPQAIKP